MAEQLTFDLARRPALGREDFFVAPANALAVALVDGWPDWPSGKLVLIGPEGSGKTHLAHVFAAETGATILPAEGLADRDIPALTGTPLVVEDVPRIAGEAADEAALFHLHNLALAERCPLLLTGRGEPHLWPLNLPDLKSRMQGTAVARLEDPDDALLTALLTKLFADRQIAPAPDVIPWLLKRIDRTFAAAQAVVARLDAAAMDQRRALTVHLARATLDDPAKGN